MELETGGFCVICCNLSEPDELDVDDGGIRRDRDRDQETYAKFCGEILSVPNNNVGGSKTKGGGLPKLFSEFSICPECLILFRKAVKCRSFAGEVELRVRELQRRLLTELRELKRRMEWVYLDVKLIAEIVKKKEVKMGDSYATRLRGEIIRAEASLAKYNTRLFRKLLINDDELTQETVMTTTLANMKVQSQSEHGDSEDDPNGIMEEDHHFPGPVIYGPPFPRRSASSMSGRATPSPNKKKMSGGNKRNEYKIKKGARFSKKKKPKTGGEGNKLPQAQQLSKRGRGRPFGWRKDKSKSEGTGAALVSGGRTSTSSNAPPDLETNMLNYERPRKRLKCRRCDYSSNEGWNLRRHMKVHSKQPQLYRGSDEPPPLSSEEAAGGAAGPVSTTNSNGAGSKSRGKRHKCQQCSFTCGGGQALQAHMECHNSEGKPYKCDLCNCYFVAEVALYSHKAYRHKTIKQKLQVINSHIEEVQSTNPKYKKVYKCKLCNKRFSQRNNTSFHIQTVHWGQRSFKCPEPNCAKMFARKPALENHKLTHAERKKPFKCPVCGSSYGRSYDMLKHKKRAHPEASTGGDATPGTSG